MSEDEKEGAILFFGKAQCGSCHTGPALNNMDFHALGMPDLQGSAVHIASIKESQEAGRGRGGFTGNPDDDFKFKTPQLYNLKDSPFYGHGGSFTSIMDVLTYKMRQFQEIPTFLQSTGRSFCSIEIKQC